MGTVCKVSIRNPVVAEVSSEGYSTSLLGASIGLKWRL